MFVVLESERPLAGGVRYCLHDVEEVVIGRGATRTATREVVEGITRLFVRIPSRHLSAVHARLRRTDAGWALADAGSTNGSYVNGERVASASIGPDDVIEVGRVFVLAGPVANPAVEPPGDRLGAALDGRPDALATLRPDLEQSFAELSRIAASRLTLILWGETGTGKEMMARAVHALSGRPGGFVGVNCGALPSTLVETQLFGHVRGAFSGAIADATGFVRAAEGGTLLLDEVQDLPLPAQATLLRVLQESEVIPVGSTRAIRVDVRFVATAPAPLDEAVNRGAFRADLLARLAGFAYRLAPLRERRQDLGVLIAALLRRAGVQEDKDVTLAPEFALSLFAHSFPLNVRELEQLLSRGLSLAQGGVVDVDFPVVRTSSAPAAAGFVEAELSPRDQELRERVTTALRDANGNVAETARVLGKAPVQVRRWLRRFAIDPERFRR